jgi:hypothetical protein
VVIAHFANSTLNNYPVNFPSTGSWYVHLNSDSTNYGSDYGNIGSTVVTATGNPAQGNITIGPYSALILSQIPDHPPQVAITSTNGTVTISWLSVYAGWGLERTASLTELSTWAPVSNAVFQTNGPTLSVTLSPAAASSFYRLQKL